MKGETPTTPTTLPVKLNLPDGTCGVVYNQKIDLAPLQRTMQNIISCEADGFEAAGLSFSWEDELQIDGVPQKHGLFPITILLNFGAENEKSSQAYRLRGDLSILADLRKRTQDDSLSEKLLDLNIHAIQNNPYRTLGLLVGATKREQERHLKRLKHFIDAEIEVEDDWSFPILGELNRTIDSINDASSKLNLDGDKMSAALFWFYNGNAITDETAFEAIKDGNTEIAIDIWRKLACRSTDEPYNEITSRNASAFHNLSTLYLQKYGIDEETLQLKLLFLESDYFRELKNRATDETYRISQKEIQLMFLNILIQDNSIETDELIEAISNIEFSAKEVFLTGFIQKPIQELDAIINECNQRRQSKMTDVIVAGTNLYNKSKSRLSQLEEILGASDLRYTAMADKVATEVLQCGIQLFNDYKDSKTYDPGEPAMALFLKATLIAKGTIARQRCQENTESIQEWIESKPEREFQNKVGNEVDYIIKKLNLAVATLNNKGKYPKGYNDPYSNLPFDQQPHNRDDSNYRKEIDDFLRS